MKRKSKALYLTRGAVVGASYVVLTYLSAIFGLSSGVIQLRISEALCILPIFMPEAIPGLFIGCIISNLITNAVIWDVIFGSLATLIGAFGARLLRKLPTKFIWCATLPTVLSNAVIVPLVLIYAYMVADTYFFILATVTVGEVLSATMCGSALYFALRKSKFLN